MPELGSIGWRGLWPLALSPPPFLSHSGSSQLCEGPVHLCMDTLHCMPKPPPHPPPAFSCPLATPWSQEHAPGAVVFSQEDKSGKRLRAIWEENSGVLHTEHGGMGGVHPVLWIGTFCPWGSRLLRGHQYFLYPGIHTLPNPPNFEYDGNASTIRLYYTVDLKLARSSGWAWPKHTSPLKAENFLWLVPEERSKIWGMRTLYIITGLKMEGATW